MKPQHINVEEAVQVHRDVRSMRSVACHHATFRCGAGAGGISQLRCCW